MKDSYDIAAIGNAIVDVLIRCDEAFLSNNDISKGVMTLTDRVTVDKLYINSNDSVKISGGSAANTAVGVASFGGNAAFIGKVCIDTLGNLFTSDIREMGVDFQFTPPPAGNDDASTACSYVMITPDAQRTMLTYLGVASQISLDDIREDIISKSKVTYLEGYLWDQESAKECMKQAVTLAHKHNKKVAFTLSDPFCVDRHRVEFIDLIQNNVDIVFANEVEITSLYEVNELSEAIEKIRQDCEIAIVTCSDAGSKIITKDEIFEISAAPVEDVVDTTGAGDLYAAGFLYGYCKDLPLAECGRLASVAASEIISHIGARPHVKLCNLE